LIADFTDIYDEPVTDEVAEKNVTKVAADTSVHLCPEEPALPDGPT
jgi:hypothetical protein